LQGSSCLPFSEQQLLESSFDSSFKCAVLYTNAEGNLEIDQEGVCINRQCRMCNYRSPNGGMSNCGVSDGIKGERQCVYPGYLVNTHTASWSPGYYIEIPEYVWWAVLFIFLCCFLSFQVINMVANIVIMKQGPPFNRTASNIYEQYK